MAEQSGNSGSGGGGGERKENNITTGLKQMSVQTGLLNLANSMTRLSLKNPEYAVLRTHGKLGNKLSDEVIAVINKHLDVIVLDDPGNICMTTGVKVNSEHVTSLMNLIKTQVNDKLWDRGTEGAHLRGELSNALREKFGSNISHTVQMYEPKHAWHFKNVYKLGSFTPGLQTTKNNKPRAGIEDKEFTLYDIAKNVRGGGIDITMNVDAPKDSPNRLKIIIISCQGFDAHTGGRRRRRRRRRSKIRRKKKTKRRKKKTKKRRRKRYTRRKK